MTKQLVTGHAYWRRTLAKVVDQRDAVVVGFTRDGQYRTWTGRIASTDDPSGLLVSVAGEPRRLCPWDALHSVEPAGGGQS